MRRKIKLFSPFFGKEEEKAIINTLNSGFWASGAGTGNVNKFETNFRDYVNASECVVPRIESGGGRAQPLWGPGQTERKLQ